MNEKPELILESDPDDTFLKAHCSSCKARFDLMGNGLAEKELLRTMFDLHTRRVHSPKVGDGKGKQPGNT